jgi:hypothetical protein
MAEAAAESTTESADATESKHPAADDVTPAAETAEQDRPFVLSPLSGTAAVVTLLRILKELPDVSFNSALRAFVHTIGIEASETLAVDRNTSSRLMLTYDMFKSASSYPCCDRHQTEEAFIREMEERILIHDVTEKAYDHVMAAQQQPNVGDVTLSVACPVELDAKQADKLVHMTIEATGHVMATRPQYTRSEVRVEVWRMFDETTRRWRCNLEPLVRKLVRDICETVMAQPTISADKLVSRYRFVAPIIRLPHCNIEPVLRKRLDCLLFTRVIGLSHQLCQAAVAASRALLADQNGLVPLPTLVYVQAQAIADVIETVADACQGVWQNIMDYHLASDGATSFVRDDSTDDAPSPPDVPQQQRRKRRGKKH